LAHGVVGVTVLLPPGHHRSTSAAAVALAGTGLVLERQRDRTGPSCLLRHLGWGTESRVRECPDLADLMTKESQHPSVPR